MTARDDTLPKLTMGLLAGTIAAGLVSQRLRHRRVRRGQGDEQLFTTGAGNVLAYQFAEGARPAAAGRPVLVFETGMISTAEHWVWLRRDLGGDHPVLVYNRAGYGRSEYCLEDPFTLAAAVADLRDLVRAVCPDRPVVLVGHSLGGYLALRAIEPLRDLVAGVVLLDPSHPGELHRSAAQAQGAKLMGFSLSLMPASTRLGAGALLTTPPWVVWMPPDMRPLALDQYRDWKLWTTAVREWRATHAEFLNHDGALPKIGVPVRLVAAARTHAKDKVHAELHRELVAEALSGDLHLIDDVEHDELLLNARPATEIAGLVREFVSQLGTPDMPATPATPAKTEVR